MSRETNREIELKNEIMAILENEKIGVLMNALTHSVVAVVAACALQEKKPDVGRQLLYNHFFEAWESLTIVLEGSLSEELPPFPDPIKKH